MSLTYERENKFLDAVFCVGRRYSADMHAQQDKPCAVGNCVCRCHVCHTGLVRAYRGACRPPQEPPWRSCADTRLCGFAHYRGDNDCLSGSV